MSPAALKRALDPAYIGSPFAQPFQFFDGDVSTPMDLTGRAVVLFLDRQGLPDAHYEITGAIQTDGRALFSVADTSAWIKGDYSLEVRLDGASVVVGRIGVAKGAGANGSDMAGAAQPPTAPGVVIAGSGVVQVVSVAPGAAADPSAIILPADLSVALGGAETLADALLWLAQNGGTPSPILRDLIGGVVISSVATGALSVAAAGQVLLSGAISSVSAAAGSLTVGAASSIALVGAVEAAGVMAGALTVEPGVSALSFATPGDHGNVDLVNSIITDGESDLPAVTVRIMGVAAEGISATPVWWSPFVELKGCAGKRPTFNLPNTQYRYGSFAGSQKLLWSYDARTWKAFDNQNTSGTNKIVSNNADFSGGTVFVSFMPSIPVSDRAGYWQQIAAAAPDRFRLSPGEVSGAYHTIAPNRIGAAQQPIPAVSQYAAQLEDFSSTLPKRTMVLVMGNHPSEDCAERAMLAFLRAAVADNWFMARWRVLVYYINPAGQYGGSHRTTFEGSEPGGVTALLDDDSNRGWMTEPSPLADVRAVKAKILADLTALGVSKADLYVDFHTGPDTTRVWSFITSGTPTPAEAAFRNAWTKINPSFELRDGTYAAGGSFGWAKQNVSDLSLSAEVGGGWGATSDTAYDVYGLELLAVVKSTTQSQLYPLKQSVGVFGPSASGPNKIFDIRVPAQTSESRPAWTA